MAMHLIGCVRKGLPLPELPTKAAFKKKPKKAKKQYTPAPTKPKGAEGKSLEPARSPKRRSRLASLVQCEASQGADGPCISTPKPHEAQGFAQVLHTL